MQYPIPYPYSCNRGEFYPSFKGQFNQEAVRRTLMSVWKTNNGMRIRDAPNGMILWLQRIGNSGASRETVSLAPFPTSPTSRHSSYCSSHTTTSPAGSLRPFRLDLSYNNFSGEVPVAVNGLTHLLTLRLEENRFTGSISGLNLQNLQDFNVSGNHFSGEIPKSLSGFPESAFAQNQALCGSPVKETCKNSFSDPTWPASENGAIASPLIPGTPNPNHHSSILLINYFSGSGPAILLINYQRSYQL
ncbi:probable leucine-rich repeat receptor-like protein kinase At1g68400 [Fagus crenata]